MKTTLPEPWRTLAARLGGVEALAKALQISPRTLRRWGAGATKPVALTRDAVTAFAKQHRVKLTW